MNLGGSHADVIMDDCRKSQTLDSLPGKAGGLPILIIFLRADQLPAPTKVRPKRGGEWKRTQLSAVHYLIGQFVNVIVADRKMLCQHLACAANFQAESLGGSPLLDPLGDIGSIGLQAFL